MNIVYECTKIVILAEFAACGLSIFNIIFQLYPEGQVSLLTPDPYYFIFFISQIYLLFCKKPYNHIGYVWLLT